MPGTQFTVNIKFADTKPVAAAPMGFPQVSCVRALETFWRVCRFLTRVALQQVMGHPAHAAYGGGYGQYVQQQQQQHVDPQAAAYAQYMQQVACDYRRYVFA